MTHEHGRLPCSGPVTCAERVVAPGIVVMGLWRMHLLPLGLPLNTPMGSPPVSRTFADR
jgi:hypothetical protein